MRTANATFKGLLGLTLVFSLLAAASFAAFHKPEALCGRGQKCNRSAPPVKRGGILWDDVSRHFLSLVSLR